MCASVARGSPCSSRCGAGGWCARAADRSTAQATTARGGAGGHLDVAGRRCFIAYELRRVECRDCGVRVEAVPWARPDARPTRDFEDLVAFCAQQRAKSQVQALLGIAWDTVGRIVQRVVADHLDERRLAGLVSIGCDELSYRRGQRYLTNVADHRSGRIVWSSPGRNAQTLQEFFEALGERKSSIRAVSIDMSGGYKRAVRAALPDAQIAFDPFHVVALAGRAVDDVRRAQWNAKGKSRSPEGTWLKNVRFALRKAPENLTDRQRVALAQIQQSNAQLFRAYLLKEQLRQLCHLDDPADAEAHLDAWLAGPHAPSCGRPSGLPAPSAATATASSPPSSSDSPTLGSRACTPRSDRSRTAASASIRPRP